MANIELTYRQIKNLGLWDKVCEYKGWDTWNDDSFAESDIIEFDDGFKNASQWETEYRKSIEVMNEEYREALDLAGGENMLREKIITLFETANKGLKYEMIVREMEEYLDERQHIKKFNELQEILSRGLNIDFPEDY